VTVIGDMRPLTQVERAVLRIVIEAFDASWDNATVLWVRWQLRQQFGASLTGAELCRVVRGMPCIGPPSLRQRYAPVEFGAFVGDETRLRLTAFGLALCEGSSALLAKHFAAVVSYFGKRAKDDPPPLSEFMPMHGRLSEIETLLRTIETVEQPDLVARRVARLLTNDSVGLTMGGSYSGDFSSWEMSVLHDIEAFADITSFDEYLSVAENHLRAPPPSSERRVPSPLGLHASIDYFNAVWKNAAPTLGVAALNLLALPSAEVIGRLAFGCDSLEELESRLSGLGQILKISPPKGVQTVRGQHPLKWIVPLLAQHLTSPPSLGRATDAIDRLVAVAAVRNGGQHASALPAAVRAARILGFELPVLDPDESWRSIVDTSINALEALREEVATLQT
jgi:hypothetical protein